tara:strand:+ start:1158 stop:2165 length:1008 start_codon:yes stop_codon:yes gene_type:complete
MDEFRATYSAEVSRYYGGEESGDNGENGDISMIYARDHVEFIHAAVSLWEERGRPDHLVVILPAYDGIGVPTSRTVASAAAILYGVVTTSELNIHILCPARSMRTFRHNGSVTTSSSFAAVLRAQVYHMDGVSIYELRNQMDARGVFDHLLGTPRRFGSRGVYVRADAGARILCSIGFDGHVVEPLGDSGSTVFVPWPARRGGPVHLAFIATCVDESLPAIHYKIHEWWSTAGPYIAVPASPSLDVKLRMCCPSTGVPDLLYRCIWTMDPAHRSQSDFLRYMGDTAVNVRTYSDQWSTALNAARRSNDAILECLGRLIQTALGTTVWRFIGYLKA